MIRHEHFEPMTARDRLGRLAILIVLLLFWVLVFYGVIKLHSAWVRHHARPVSSRVVQRGFVEIRP